MKALIYSRFTLAAMVMAAAIGLSACTSGPSPVINKSPGREIPPQVVVAPADSIYTISWRYGVDYLKIAKWNGLKPPYNLQPGQRLGLRRGTGVAATAPAKVVIKPLPAPAVPAAKPIPQPAPTTSSTAASAPASSAPLPALPTPDKWQWPVRGDIVSKFSPAKGVNGLRIGGAPGNRINATAAGDVVYVGEGLRGYGKLIIIKHTDKYLSAYAHNRRILVGEGDRIKAGQQIAEMGSSGAEQTMLHFEIRVNGKPQDPLKFLKG